MLLLGIFVSVLSTVATFNVLVVFPEPTKSHGHLGSRYVAALLEAGHHVTYITPFPETDRAKLTQVNVQSNLNKSKEIYDELKRWYGEKSSKFLLMLGHKFARMSVEHPNVQKLLKRNIKFDVVLAEWIDSEVYSGFAAVFDCPLIWAVSTHLHWQPLRLMDSYTNPSYSADVNTGQVTPFTFATRFTEMWLQFVKTWILHVTIKPMEQEVYDIFFKKPSNRPVEPYYEVPARYSLMFVNSQPSISSNLAVPPSVQYVGGYHIEPLQDIHDINLKTIMSESRSGVIYFSLGTTVRTKDMSTAVKSRLLRTFRKLSNISVIWKIDEDDNLNNVSDNVHVVNWAPQTALLAHENMKLFITHCGLLSMMEAIQYGVPMVAIPRRGDQFTNAALSVKHGVAIEVQYNHIGEKLESSIDTMLSSDKYKRKMSKLSSIYKSGRNNTEEIKYWVNRVIVYGGSHLRSEGLNIPLYQKWYVDIALTLVSAAVTATTVLVGLCCWCCRLHKRQQRQQQHQQQPLIVN